LASLTEEHVAQPAHGSPFLAGLRANKEAVMQHHNKHNDIFLKCPATLHCLLSLHDMHFLGDFFPFKYGKYGCQNQNRQACTIKSM
jgi:hypothetical protein